MTGKASLWLSFWVKKLFPVLHKPLVVPRLQLSEYCLLGLKLFPHNSSHQMITWLALITIAHSAYQERLKNEAEFCFVLPELHSRIEILRRGVVCHMAPPTHFISTASSVSSLSQIFFLQFWQIYFYTFDRCNFDIASVLLHLYLHNWAAHNNQVYSHKLVLPVFDCQYFVVSVFLIWTLINQHGTMSTPADQIEVYRWKMSSIWIFTVVENDYRSQRNCRSSLKLYFWVLSVCLSVKLSCWISFWFQISVKPSIILVLPKCYPFSYLCCDLLRAPATPDTPTTNPQPKKRYTNAVGAQN